MQKLTPAHLLFTLVEQYGLELGTEAFYSHYALTRPVTTGQTTPAANETFLASRSTPITAVS